MKRLLILYLILIPIISFGQSQMIFQEEFFFGRQTSARAEAMGRSYVSIDGDLSSVYFNPAGIATMGKTQLYTSFSSPYYMYKNARYDAVTSGMKVNDYFAFAIGRNNFSYGGSDLFGTYNQNYLSVYTLTTASQPLKNFYVGLNGNLEVTDGFGSAVYTGFLDFGVIKKIKMTKRGALEQSINYGLRFTNFTFSKVRVISGFSEFEAALPSILNSGLSYQMYLDKGWMIKKLKTFGFLFQTEYQWVPGYDYRSALRCGGEFQFLENLVFRAGYYVETVDPFGNTFINNRELKALTYGAGIIIPLYKLTVLPLKINFDYVNMPQPSYSKIKTKEAKFTTYSVGISVIIKSKKNDQEI